MSQQEPNQPPTVQKRTSLPPGVLPRNAQAWFIAGLALLMVLVILFSGSNAPKTTQAKDKLAPPPAMDPSQARIQEYRARIDEQARKLAAEQAQLAQTKQTLAGDVTVGSVPQRRPSEPSSSLSYSTPAPERSWIDQDREKREYQSRFSSNIALSYRATAGADAGSAALIAGTRPRPVPKRITSAEDSIEEDRPGLPDDEETAQPPADEKKSRRSRDDINRAEGKRYRLFEGTVLETVLTNRLDGAFSGPVNCMVATNVYSRNRQHMLVPQGSRILGEVKRVETFGQQRLAVVFHRLIMPDGYAVSLDQFRGLNQVGETGLRDKVNHHYLQIFGVSIAIGAIAGLSQANSRYGLDASASDAYRQGVASSLSQSSLRILDRYLNVLPTLTIREGHRVKVYLSDDLLLPAYDNHRMPSDI